MRFIVQVVAISVALATSAVSHSATAQPAVGGTGIQDRYCLQGRSWGYPGNCQFSSYRQCMASASGTFATCGINPAYAYAWHRRGQR
jgi:Protein of unknown function (DUF3551)